jgi:putative flippase GtrA
VIERLAEQVRRHAGLIAEASGYLAVSVVALCIDFGIYWLLLGLFAKAFVPAALAYACGLVVHYLLASRLVFKARLKGRGITAETPTFAKYTGTGLAGLAMTAAIVGFATEILGWSAFTAKVLATGFAFVAVYLMQRYAVFAVPAGTAAARA